MKKLLFLMVGVLALGLVFAGCGTLTNITVPSSTTEGFTYLSRGTEGDPGEYPLYAGQNKLVGNVLVWNDDEKLCVRYELDEDALDEGWLIYETHWAVGEADEDGNYITDTGIPTNSSGNPQVGLFPYGDDKLGGVEFYEECILFEELKIGCDEEIVIAAHVVIKRQVPLEDCWEEVWQIGDVEKDQMDNPCDEFNYPDIVYGIQDFYVETTQTAEFPWISRFDRNYAPIINIYFNDELPFGGKLLISWSPGASGREIWMASLGGTELGTIDRIGIPVEGWWNKYEFFIETFDIDPTDEIDHILNITFASGDGAVWDWIRLKRPCVEEESETAWAADGKPGEKRFVQRGNWATYFNYTVECPTCLGCPGILKKSYNIEVLDNRPYDVSVGELESNDKIRVWKEFEGPLPEDLYYDLHEGDVAKDGLPANHSSYMIPADTNVCIYYVHYDQVGETYSPPEGIKGFIEFEANILGLIISGGTLGDFANLDLMFEADDIVGYSGTIYPNKTDNWQRGFEIDWSLNTDDAEFDGHRVDFNVWVAEQHDSMRVILPLVEVTCD